MLQLLAMEMQIIVAQIDGARPSANGNAPLWYQKTSLVFHPLILFSDNNSAILS